MRSIMLVAALVAAVAPARAQDESAGGVAIVGRAGTLGLGLEVGRALSEKWTLRLGANLFSYDRDITESDINYDASLDLRNAGLTLDWHPFSGSFRMSLGAFHNANEFSVRGRPAAGTFDINGTTYTAAQIGELSGKVDFERVAPMLAIGWGNTTRKGFTYSVDIGVLYQRAPRAQLSVTCGSGVNCGQLQADVAAEQRQLQDDLDGYKFWPVLQLGVGWVF